MTDIFEDPEVGAELSTWRKVFNRSPSEALLRIEQLVEAYPDNRAALVGLAANYWKLEDFSASVLVCRKVVRRWPDEKWCQERIQIQDETHSTSRSSDTDRGGRSGKTGRPVRLSSSGRRVWMPAGRQT